MGDKKHGDEVVDPESREYEGPTGLPESAGGSKVPHDGPSGLPEKAGGSHKGQPGASGLPKVAGGHPDATEDDK